jgi:outer membrane receptor protein involved in Fe transport
LANFLYRYNEQIFSAYGIFGQQIGKIKYQGGIRVEKAYQIPELVSDSIRIVNDYLNFFPSAHVRYAFTPKSEMSLSYSRRINRASSGDLNPFTNYSDPFNLRKGNPYLQPEYIDSYDLGYSNELKKITLTASVFYRYTTGVITRVKEFYSNNTAAVTFANIDKSHSVGLEFIAVIKPYKWWKNTISANANYIQYVDNTPGVNWNVNGINWNVKYAGTVEFWKKTASIQVNAAYNAPRISVQGRAQRRGPIDISGEKTFNDGKWSLGFKVTDIFNRQGFYLTVDQPGIDQVVEFKWLTRKYFLTFSYKFGKLEMSNKKQSGGDGGGFDM